MDTVVSQDDTVLYLKNQIADPPHLIFIGPTGCGKTHLANEFINASLAFHGVTQPEQRAAMILRLSSADDRGISALRQRLTDFVRRVRPVATAFSWVLIDDADNLPTVTQQALRRILELYVNQTRFIFIAHSKDTFIEPIQSRCIIRRFNPVDLSHYGRILAKREHADLTDESIELMAALANGNARQFLLMCRATNIADAHTPVQIQSIINTPPVKILLSLRDAVANACLSTIAENCLALWSRGYSFEECISMLEQVVYIYSETMTSDMRHVLKCCAEGHVYQILNKTTTMDLIAVLGGKTSADCLA